MNKYLIDTHCDCCLQFDDTEDSLKRIEDELENHITVHLQNNNVVEPDDKESLMHKLDEVNNRSVTQPTLELTSCF